MLERLREEDASKEVEEQPVREKESGERSTQKVLKGEDFWKE